jgi:hypothetical protein
MSPKAELAANEVAAEEMDVKTHVQEMAPQPQSPLQAGRI